MTEGTPVSKDSERRARLQAAMRDARTSGPRATIPAPAEPATPAGAGASAGGAGRAGSADGTGSAVAAGRRRSPLALVADRRGLTAIGIVLLDLIGGFVGLVHDLNTGSHILGTVTAIAFATATVIAAMIAHREDLAASVIVPPLAYACVVLVAAGDTAGAGTGSYVHTIAEEAVVHVLTSAPGLLVGVAAALVVAVFRFLAGRAAANRRRAAARARHEQYERYERYDRP
jgi:hypothetical protein